MDNVVLSKDGMRVKSLIDEALERHQSGTALAATLGTPDDAELARIVETLKVSVASPMTAADHVRSVTVLSGRNPRPVVATFHLGPKAGRAEVFTRVRLNGSQRLLAVAQLSDGSFWSGSAEVVVTEAACLDES